MTHVADDAMLGKFVRRIKGLIERAMAGSLDIEKLWDIVQGYLDGKLKNVDGVLSGTYEIKPIDNVIDLGSPAKLPFDGAERESPPKSGVVKIECKDDILCLDGKSINLFFSEKQKNGGSIGGHDLYKEIEARGGNVSAKVLDHLVVHRELWPESWKKDAQGNTIYVYFWDDIFRDPTSGELYVRLGFWHDSGVISYFCSLEKNLDGNDPTASLTS
jgi:hypothetical protein